MKNTVAIGRIASAAALALPSANATAMRDSAANRVQSKAGDARTLVNGALTQKMDIALRSSPGSPTNEMRAALAKLASDYLSGDTKENPFKTVDGTLLMHVIANANGAFSDDERRAAFVEAESRGTGMTGSRNNAISAYTTTQSFQNIGAKTLFDHIAQSRSRK